MLLYFITTMTETGKKPSRCNLEECNKKLKFSDMMCRCEKRFCSLHRLPEQHICSIDYKFINPVKLEKCVGEKIIKI